MDIMGQTVQIMGHHAIHGAPTPMYVLNERLVAVLGHLQTIVPGSVMLAPPGSGLPHQIAFSHGRVNANLDLQCVVGQGIVVHTPLSVYRGMRLRTPKIAPAVDSFVGGGPIGGVMEDIVMDEWESDEPQYCFGQGDELGMMYQLEFVSNAPGPDHKYLVYKCKTEAELACFLDAFLGTYIWDSICEGI